MVLEWTLGLKRLPYSSVSLRTSQGDSDILCESCACIIHTNLQSCMFIISDTLHDHHNDLKREPQRFQATSYWVPEDQGTGVSV